MGVETCLVPLQCLKERDMIFEELRAPACGGLRPVGKGDRYESSCYESYAAYWAGGAILAHVPSVPQGKAIADHPRHHSEKLAVVL